MAVGAVTIPVLFLITLLAVLLMLLRILQRELFQTTKPSIVYTTNKLNHNGTKDITLASARTVYSFISQNKRFPDDIINGAAWAASPIEYDLYLSKTGATAVRKRTGYHVALGLPEVMYGEDCAFNWHNKRIGYIEWCDMYLVKAIMRGYRIPDAAVEVVEVPMSKWDALDEFMRDNRIHVIVAFIVPDSNFLRLLQLQRLSAVGWGKLNMDRVRVFHPYVKSVRVDAKKLLTNDGSTALAVMDREKYGPLLQMTHSDYTVRSGGTARREGFFVTRLTRTPESVDPTYRCYGDLTIEQKALCDSPYDAFGDPKQQPTIWDRPCVKNEDCPFYKANKTYPNTRGGCLRGGVCEMPTGVLRTAFRKYDAQGQFTPFCYGCADPRDASCCSKQKQPDYAFSNDTDARKRANVASFVSAI